MIRYRTVSLLLLVLLAACGTGNSKEETHEDPVAAEIETFTMEHYRGVEPRWTLNAERAEVLATRRVRLIRPRILIYDNGAPTLSITGDEGEVNRDTFDLEVRGDVRAVSADAVLLTQKLRWRDADGKLTAPAEVTIHRGDSIAVGSRMESEPDLKRVQLYDAYFRLHPKDEKIESYSLDTLDE